MSSNSSNSTFTNRLRRESLDLQQSPVPYTCAGPTADSLKQWLVVFEGQPGSLYDGGTFFALLTFDDDYPFTPPTVIHTDEFKTRIYHCNVHQNSGLVRHDIFDKNWSPTITIRQIIQQVANLLVQCDPEHCAMKELGLQYKYERADYEKMARLWTKNFAR